MISKIHEQYAGSRSYSIFQAADGSYLGTITADSELMDGTVRNLGKIRMSCTARFDGINHVAIRRLEAAVDELQRGKQPDVTRLLEE